MFSRHRQFPDWLIFHVAGNQRLARCFAGLESAVSLSTLIPYKLVGFEVVNPHLQAHACCILNAFARYKLGGALENRTLHKVLAKDLRHLGTWHPVESFILVNQRMKPCCKWSEWLATTQRSPPSKGGGLPDFPTLR